MAYKKPCRLCRDKSDIDYKDVNLLNKYIDRSGKIVPKFKSGNCAKHQRRISVAVKRARNIALLPFVR
ncbi:MAG: 30S ribosomal protein S18 [Elusimicrobia bacterium]|nr:30S ribosomal protein S18 [Elusimicrobiota bacterium]